MTLERVLWAKFITLIFVLQFTSLVLSLDVQLQRPPDPQDQATGTPLTISWLRDELTAPGQYAIRAMRVENGQIVFSLAQPNSAFSISNGGPSSGQTQVQVFEPGTYRFEAYDTASPRLVVGSTGEEVIVLRGREPSINPPISSNPPSPSPSSSPNPQPPRSDATQDNEAPRTTADGAADGAAETSRTSPSSSDSASSPTTSPSGTAVRQTGGSSNDNNSRTGSDASGPSPTNGDSNSPSSLPPRPDGSPPSSPDQPSDPNSQSAKKSIPVGAIVGGVIGGLVVLLITFLIVRHRRRPRITTLSPIDQMESDPYTLDRAAVGLAASGTTPSSGLLPAAKEGLFVSDPFGVESSGFPAEKAEHRNPPTQEPETVGTNMTRPPSYPATLPPPSIRHHLPAMSVASDDDWSTLPPDYEQVFARRSR